MVWTTPLTAGANGTLTAANWNLHVRDNSLETEAGKASRVPEVTTDPDEKLEIVPGTWFVATAANAIAERRVIEGNVSGNDIETTTSTSYTDLETYGPSITLTIGTAVIVMLTCEIGNLTANAASFADFDISGATTRASADATCLRADGYSAGSGDNFQRRAVYTRLTGLTAGSCTFTMKYKCASGTGQFRMRQMVVWPI